MTAAADEVYLSYKGVHKSFGSIHALNGVDLDIHKGEIFGFIGPDGAGKTTLIRIAMGIVNPDEGECRLLGTEDRRSTRVHAGYVSQRFGLYTDMTVAENAALFGSLYGTPEKEALANAERILSRTGLWPFKDRLVGNLSGGMKQKLALGTGLLHTPKILFLDEPTTGVDPVARREFWAMLYELNQGGLTIIVSTPYMDEAELCTRKMFISEGRILDVGTTSELLSRFKNSILEIDFSERRAKRWLMKCEHVVDVNMFGSSYHAVVDDVDAATHSIESAFKEQGKTVPSMETVTPTLEDLFVAFAGEASKQR